MKKSLIAFAALSAIAGMAQAQSTVTLYGLLDANIGSYKSNVLVGTTIQNLTQTKIESAGLNGSRWGMRVREDLGNGLAAIGNLESGISLDTGTISGTTLFSRRANVGLTGGFGTVTIGRNSSSYDDVSGDHALMGQTIFDPSNVNNGPSASSITALGAAFRAPVPTATAAAVNGTGLLARTRTWVGYQTRFNNSVKYISPDFGGFSGSAMYAFNEDKTPSVGASKTVSAYLKYANGPLLVSGGYQSEGDTRSATGSKPALENTLLSVAYDLGVAKIGAGFNRAKLKDVFPGLSLAAQKEYNLSVAVPLGATTLSAGVARSKGDDLGKSTGFGVQALYALSKRTTLYAGANSIKSYDQLGNALRLLSPTSNIGRNTTYAAGVRHTF